MHSLRQVVLAFLERAQSFWKAFVLSLPLYVVDICRYVDEPGCHFCEVRWKAGVSIKLECLSTCRSIEHMESILGKTPPEEFSNRS